LLEIEFEDEEYETLNGFLISKLDRIPEPNEQFSVDYEGFHFKIMAVKDKMIQSVLVTKCIKCEEPVIKEALEE
ncbi:MAG: HlyC/CorC family transporter, partial [Lachnospiraceae bacterium]|nr:HlyC/CorC family transporter [Lachnospiraceae bacterium]